MKDLENLYAAYMDGDEPALLARDCLPSVDWNTRLKWPQSIVDKMGAANKNVQNGMKIQTARILGAASILGEEDERMVQFRTSTNGEYFIHIRRGKMVGRVAIETCGKNQGLPAARPFLRVDRQALAVYFRGEATAPRAAGSDAVLYDQLQVGGYTCLVEPAEKGQVNDIYRKPNKIESMQVVSEIPEWCVPLLPWGVRAGLPQPGALRGASYQSGEPEDTAAQLFE